jgi:hypothetical protein
MFTEPARERAFPTTAVAIAATALVILAAVLVMLGRRSPAAMSNAVQPPAAYAHNLVFSDVHMSDATTGSGGHILYVEGHVANRGPATLTGVTVQVAFGNDMKLPAQIETAPLTLIYMREPYVDSHPLSAAPLAPAAEGDFRLIFDDVSDNWNQQLPEIRVTQTSTR